MTPIYHLQTAKFNNIGSCKSNVQAWCSVPYSAVLFLHKKKCRTVLAYSYMKNCAFSLHMLPWAQFVLTWVCTPMSLLWKQEHTRDKRLKISCADKLEPNLCLCLTFPHVNAAHWKCANLQFTRFPLVDFTPGTTSGAPRVSTKSFLRWTIMRHSHTGIGFQPWCTSWIVVFWISCICGTTMLLPT